MARIDGSGPRSVATPRSEPRPEPKPASSPAAQQPSTRTERKPADNFVPDRATRNFSRGAQADMGRLASNPRANATTNRDGSVTRSTSRTEGRTTREQELTTSRGVTGNSRLQYTNTSTGPNQTTKNTYNSQTDSFRRTTSSHEREVTRTRGNTTQTDTRTQATDHRGNTTNTRAESTAVANGNTTNTTGQSVTTDSRGNRSTTTTSSTEVRNGENNTTTRSSRNTSGTSQTTTATSGYENGTFRVGQSTEYRNQRFDTERSFNHERQLRPSTADSGFTQTRRDGLSYAQQGGNALAAAGARTNLVEGEFNNIQENNRSTAPNTFVGTRHGTSGSQNVSIGTDGVNASYNREARAGVYAERSGETTGQYGTASYNAHANAEARASVNATGRLDTNGLDASVNARVGARAEASVTGRAESQSIQIAGVDVNASVQGRATASAEVAAEANGRVQVTRNPPTAVAEGSVGASAVAKVEGEVTASAGPFSVNASAYASAGAEARASGVIGYEDGKLRIGGSVGAALGVGAGGAVNVEVDVAQIGQMAHNAADVNNDGRLGLDDAGAAVSNTVNAARDTVSNAASTVRGWFGW